MADTRRQVQVDWFHDGICETRVVGGALVGRRARSRIARSARRRDHRRWIEAVLRGEAPVPGAIARQVELIADIARTPV